MSLHSLPSTRFFCLVVVMQWFMRECNGTEPWKQGVVMIRFDSFKFETSIRWKYPVFWHLEVTRSFINTGVRHEFTIPNMGWECHPTRLRRAVTSSEKKTVPFKENSEPENLFRMSGNNLFHLFKKGKASHLYFANTSFFFIWPEVTHLIVYWWTIWVGGFTLFMFYRFSFRYYH